MAIQALIDGQRNVGLSKRTNWAAAAQAGLNQADAIADVNRRKRKQAQQAIKNKTESYINSLNSNVDLSELTSDQQGAITNFLVKKRNEYAQAASALAKIEDPSSEEYLRLRDQMNNVQNSFTNLAKQLKTYKEDKVNFLNDFDNGLLSEGNDLSTLNEASNMYTDQASIGVDDQGGLVFWNESQGTYNPYNKMQKPFLKDFKAADGLLQLNEKIYSAGAPLTGARRNMIRQRLNNLISQGGRDTLLSLATDDFIIEGGLGIQDPSLFERGNEDALKAAVLNGYMDSLEESARQGYAEKQAKAKSAGGRSMSALDQEVAAAGGIVQDAANFANKVFSKKVGSIEERASLVATELNALDPTSTGEFLSRGQAYNAWLEGNEMEHSEEAANEFKKLYPREFQLFYFGSKAQKPVGLNINEPRELYEYYIQNSNLSNKAKNRIITGSRQQQAQAEQQEQKTNATNTSVDTSKYNQ